MNEKEINPEMPQAPNQTPQQPVVEDSKSPLLTISRQQLLFTILGLVIILAGAVWYWQTQMQQTVTPDGALNSPPTEDQTPEPAQPVVLADGSYFVPPVLPDSAYTNPPKPNTPVQWKSPVETEDLKLVAAVQPDNNSKISYHNLGTNGSNVIIMAEAPAVDPGGSAIYFFEKSGKDYIFMELMSNSNIYRGADSPGDYALSPTITTADIKTYYQGLVGPNKLSWSGLNFEQPYLRATGLFTNYLDERKTVEGFSAKKVATVPSGDLYLIQLQNGAGGVSPQVFYIRRYVLKLPSGLYTTYSIQYNFFSDDRVPAINWTDGTKNKDTYRADGGGGGCGNPGAYIVSSMDISGAIKVTGKTSTGLSVYEFTSSNNPVLKFYYDQQGGQYYNQTTQQMEPISIEQWYTHHPVIAIKNSIGDYVLMTNDTYGLAAECGKPVVYLYPTEPTNVSVKVGANITKSEPNYNQGWKVLAQPNGKLRNTGGQVYDSLFWEGIGYGDYPSISSGFIVARDKVESAITEQLKQQGLNDKESQDFKDFWMSKMPNTPYVRLTWFTTAQMDQLAPLYISPKPDTVIRVFLDFQGLDKFINIPEQHLTALPRKGFTVIEWGGLLRK